MQTERPRRMGVPRGNPRTPARIVGTHRRARMGEPVYYKFPFPHRKNNRHTLCGRFALLSYRGNTFRNVDRLLYRSLSRNGNRPRTLVERHPAKNIRAIYRSSERIAENRARTSHYHLVRNGQQGNRLYDGARRYHRRHSTHVKCLYRHRPQ